MSSDGPLVPSAGPATVERVPAAPVRVDRRSPPFEALAFVLVLVLVLLAAGLTVANARQGPQLRAASVDPERASTSGGQRWTLDLDQRVDPAATLVALDPAVPHTVETSGARVSVRFERALDVGTTYRLRLTTTSAVRRTSSTLVQTLETPPAETFVLRRHGRYDLPGTDEVLRTDVRTGRQEPVYAAAGLQELAAAPPYLAVIRTGDRGPGSATVQVVALPGARTDLTSLRLPPGTVATQLRGSGPRGVFGYLISAGQEAAEPVESGLHVLDPVTGRSGVVAGPDGHAFDPLAWFFVPGTTQLVVQTIDSQVWLADPWNQTPPRPLGGHTSLDGFVVGTKQVLLRDGESRSALDLQTGATTPRPAPTAPPGHDVYESWEVPASLPRPVLLSSPGIEGEQPGLTLVVGDDQQPVWSTTDASTVGRACPSSDAQYLALELVPPGAPEDGYRWAPGYLGSRTVVVDLRHGRVSSTVEASASTWCR